MKTIENSSLKKKDRQAIEAAARLLRSRYPIEKIILYGSKATGADTDESDVDLLLLTSHSLSWQERDNITEALFDIQLEYGVVISTLVVSTVEWTTGYYSVLPIYDEIERHGLAA